jgi:hypothetical protein
MNLNPFDPISENSLIRKGNSKLTYSALAELPEARRIRAEIIE